jgi:hypothetical protein
MGRLQVFVYRELLMLVASEPYHPPWNNPSPRSWLTNTSLQAEDVQRGSRRKFWSPIADNILPQDWKEQAFQQICHTSAEVFLAASRTAAGGLVLLPGCFQLFALDFLIDTKGSVWLLEVNGSPAISRDGEGGSLMLRLFDSITCVTVGKLVQMDDNLASGRLVEVFTEELGKSNIREILY